MNEKAEAEKVENAKLFEKPTRDLKPWTYADVDLGKYVSPGDPEYDPEKYVRVSRSILYTPHPKVLKCLKELDGIGLFGVNLDDVLDRLVCERLIQLTEDGWLERDS